MINAQPSIKQRLESLFDSIMADEKLPIPGPFKPVANNLVKNFLKTADPDEIRKIIIDLRDNVIPWLLGEKDF